jgi:anti-sigma B factor antagonist
VSEPLEVVSGAHGVIVRVTGRLDAKSVPALLARCAEVRANGGHLIVNLSRVEFIASSGVGTLLSVAEEFRKAGRRVRFASPSAPVLSVIQLLNLEPFLPIDASEQDAERALEA